MPTWLIVIVAMLTMGLAVCWKLIRRDVPNATGTASASPPWERLRTEADTRQASADGTFRVRPGSSLRGGHWDPHDAAQSRRQQLRTSRRQRLNDGPVHGTDRPRPARISRTRKYYVVLEVAESATMPEIEQAYRRLAARHHPDQFFNDPPQRVRAEAKLKALNEAIRVLRDPTRHSSHDESRSR